MQHLDTQMHNSIINDSTFIWYNNSQEEVVTCSIQPSNIGTDPSLLNLIKHPMDITLITSEVEREFKCGDKVHALGVDWFIYNIGEVHPIVGHPLEHKTLTLKPLLTKRFTLNYISSLFAEQDSDDTIIKKIKAHIKNSYDEIELIEQFETAQEDTGNIVLLSLEEINYIKQNTRENSSFVVLSTLKFHAIGEKAHSALRELYKDLRDANNMFHRTLEKSLELQGISGPAQYLTISQPTLGEFNMVNSREPEILLTMQMEVPFLERVESPCDIVTIDLIIKTKVNYLNTIRSYNARISKSNS